MALVEFEITIFWLTQPGVVQLSANARGGRENMQHTASVVC